MVPVAPASDLIKTWCLLPQLNCFDSTRGKLFTIHNAMNIYLANEVYTDGTFPTSLSIRRVKGVLAPENIETMSPNSVPGLVSPMSPLCVTKNGVPLLRRWIRELLHSFLNSSLNETSNDFWRCSLCRSQALQSSLILEGNRSRVLFAIRVQQCASRSGSPLMYFRTTCF